MLRLTLFLTLPLPALAQDVPRVAVTYESNIVYAKPNGKPLKLDLAYPSEGKGPFPAVVCVHGGAWRMSDRTELTLFAKRLASEGFVVATVDYRLAPDHRFPACLEDVKSAVRWMRANAQTHHLRPEKIGAIGFSAGGHLVTLLGLTDKTAGFEGTENPGFDSSVQAVVDFFGPTDLTLYADDETSIRSIFEPLLGCKCKDNPEPYRKASPVSYVKKNAPPMLMFHGTRDWIVPIEQSRTFEKKMTDAGNAVQLIEMPGESHGWMGAKMRNSVTTTVSFLRTQLK